MVSLEEQILKMPEGRPSNGYSSKKQRKETDPDKACWNARPSIATQGLNNQRQQRDNLPLGRQPQVPVHGKPVKRQTSRVFYNTKYQKPPTDGERNTKETRTMDNLLLVPEKDPMLKLLATGATLLK